MNTEKITKIAEKLQNELVEIRRHIHQHPELGYEEHETCRYIAQQLQGLGLKVEAGVGGTGVVALLKGSRSGKTIMLRADIDALPIEEKGALSYASVNPGKMHACGHDAHTAILIGAARILSQMKEDVPGTVKFLFQPAEEPPKGSLHMIEAGVMENPHVDAAIATHVWPDIPSGKYGVRSGNTMASADFFRIEIKGKGSHGSQPEKGIDPIAVGHDIYEAFKTIPTRFAGVLDPVVASITEFQAGTCENTFPDTCILAGTMRTYNEQIHAKLPHHVEHLLKCITEQHGATYHLDYRVGCPAVINDEKMASLASEAIVKLYGADAIMPTPYPAMGSEDFSEFARRVPGVLFWTGIRNESAGSVYPLHHPQFTLDEAVLSRTAAAISQMAIDWLSAQA